MLGSSGGLWFTAFLLLGCWLILLLTAAIFSKPGVWPGNFSEAKPNPGGGGGLAPKLEENKKETTKTTLQTKQMLISCEI